MADIDQERADLHALVREAHEAIKDLNAAIRMIDERIAAANGSSDNLLKVIEDIDEVARVMMLKDVGDVLEKAVKDQIAAYSESWQDAIKQSEMKVFQRFDTIFHELTVGVPGVPKFGSIADEIIADKKRKQ